MKGPAMTRLRCQNSQICLPRSTLHLIKAYQRAISPRRESRPVGTRKRKWIKLPKFLYLMLASTSQEAAWASKPAPCVKNQSLPTASFASPPSREKSSSLSATTGPILSLPRTGEPGCAKSARK